MIEYLSTKNEQMINNAYERVKVKSLQVGKILSEFLQLCKISSFNKVVHYDNFICTGQNVTILSLCENV